MSYTIVRRVPNRGFEGLVVKNNNWTPEDENDVGPYAYEVWRGPSLVDADVNYASEEDAAADMNQEIDRLTKEVTNE